MATRKTQTFLPQIFQTDANQKFLSATMDQLVSEPDLQTLYGYVGRKFAPTFNSTDSYVIEDSADAPPPISKKFAGFTPPNFSPA